MVARIPLALALVSLVLAQSDKPSRPIKVQVNLEPTPYSGIVDCALEGPAGELLPQLIMK